MEKRISSKGTKFSILFNTIAHIVWSALMLLPISLAFPNLNEDLDKFLLSAFISTTFFMSLCYFQIQLKTVYEGPEGLRIKSFFSEMKIKYSDIQSVEYQGPTAINTTIRIKITFKEKTPMGKSIKFIPATDKDNFIPNQKEHPIATQLREKAKKS